MPEDSDIFLQQVPADGSAIGNIRLRKTLGWEEDRYLAVRDALIDSGVLIAGRGRGGSVMRTAANRPNTAGEIFSDKELESMASAPRRTSEKAVRSKKAKPEEGTPVTSYQYPEASRKNIPPAGLATKSTVQETDPHRLAYDPHLSPVLRFDSTAGTDRLTTKLEAILERAKSEPLTPEETQLLSDALLRSRQPWLEWAGKQEKRWFEVDPVALHIHERVRARAILKAAQREDLEPTFWGDGKLSREEAMSFYRHDVDWENRLILGDSLQVMTSLARREGLAGKVQMIYIDPPYGIKFSSNWQNEVGKRDVKDKDEDLTREPEMIKAYRDTWTLGVHSYLDYLKQRLIAARELLTDSGSVFVQISDENLHRVRTMMDEVFGSKNYAAQIAFSSTTGQTSSKLAQITDYLLWYAKDIDKLDFNNLYDIGPAIDDPTERYVCVETPCGEVIDLSVAQKSGEDEMPEGRVLKLQDVTSQTGSDSSRIPVEAFGRKFVPGGVRGWSSSPKDGIPRAIKAERIHPQGNNLWWKSYRDKGRLMGTSALWLNTRANAFSDPKLYVVRTAAAVLQRCIQLATKPGDLVLDPTCGSGTTAYVAEQWGRRWITIDSSRVAVAIARQRLLTAKFETYKTKDPSEGVDPNQPKNPKTGFIYKTVPHITLKSIAQNKSLDPIFEKHVPILEGRLEELNRQVAKVAKEEREGLVAKLVTKHQQEGARAVTDADQRRWLLPGTDPQIIQQTKGGKGLKAITAKQAAGYREAIPGSADVPVGKSAGSANEDVGTPGWREWEVPFDTDPDWPKPLQDALTAYRHAWRAKMDEVNACIEANAEQEELVDQPDKVPGVVRVSGPFTVESVRPLEDSLKGGGDEAPDSPIEGAPDELGETFDSDETYAPARDVTNAANHIERMIALLRVDGVTFDRNRHLSFERLDPIESEFLHADGETVAAEGEEARRVAVVIGPEHGAVGSFQVKTAVSSAVQRGYDELIFAGFAFDAAAQDRIHEENEDPASALKRVHMAQIRPDVLMGDLLKGNKAGKKAAESAKASQQIFTVAGQVRKPEVEKTGDEYVVTMTGVDVYDPLKNSIEATKAGKVAAWFLDTDYDGRTFCICQAFFPDKKAWEKLSKTLSGSIDPEAFAAFSGTRSLPFHAGKHQRLAIKVIDPRGNEVMRVLSLAGSLQY